MSHYVVLRNQAPDPTIQVIATVINLDNVEDISVSLIGGNKVFLIGFVSGRVLQFEFTPRNREALRGHLPIDNE